MAVQSIVSRRYAEGLYDAAKDRGILDVVRKELHEILELLDSEEDLKKAIYHQQITEEEKKRVVDLIFGNRVSFITINLLNLLIEKKRIEVLPMLVEDFNELVREERNEIIARVQTARPLSMEHQERLGDELTKVTGKRVLLNIEVNPELIGGLTVEIAGQVIDGSISGYLKGLKENITVSRSLGL